MINRFNDLTGKRFGYLLVFEETEKKSSNSIVWKCRCDCGNIHETTAARLISGKVRSCGCLKKETLDKKKGFETKDLRGQRFGRLEVLELTEKRSCSNIIWKCRCDCGNIHEVSTAHLKRGSIRSCGCLSKE